MKQCTITKTLLQKISEVFSVLQHKLHYASQQYVQKTMLKFINTHPPTLITLCDVNSSIPCTGNWSVVSVRLTCESRTRDHICKLCIRRKNHTVIYEVRYFAYCDVFKSAAQDQAHSFGCRTLAKTFGQSWLNVSCTMLAQRFSEVLFSVLVSVSWLI